MSTQRAPDPFAPVEGIVTILLGVLVAGAGIFAAIVLVQAVLGGGSGDVSFATIGDESACATVETGTLPTTDGRTVVGLDRDASAISREVEICLQHPTFWQKAASTMEPIGAVVFTIGSLLLIRRVIRKARRGGLFTEASAATTRQLGWFLLVMTGLWPFVAAAGRGVVVEAAVGGEAWTDQLFSPGISITLVVTSLGVLTFARILRRTVPLQDEISATV